MGRKQFQTLTVSLPSQVYAQIIQQPATAIAASGTETVHLYAPSGTIAKVLGARLQAPGIATATGTHNIAVSMSTGPGALTQGVSNGPDAVHYNEGFWLSATYVGSGGGQFPDGTHAPQSWWMGNTQFDAANGIVCTYSNNTNLAQNGTRLYAFDVLEVTNA